MPRIEIEDRVIWESLEAIAKAGGLRSVTSMVKAIGSQQLSLSEALGYPLQQSYLKAVSSLLEKGMMEDAQLIIRNLLFRSDLSDSVRVELERLIGVGSKWVEEVRELIANCQPFKLHTEHNSYICLYGDFWVGTLGSQRTYLRVRLLDQPDDSDDLPALAHNRVFRLDQDYTVEPVLDSQWLYSGLDTIEVCMSIKEGFRYTPQPEDVSIQAEKKRTIVTRRCWSAFWLLQDLRRYADFVVVINPVEIRQIVIAGLNATLNAYAQEYSRSLELSRLDQA